jgi:tryptophan synthase alpha subunit
MPDLRNRISEIRTVTNLPLAVGFGISTANHVDVVLQYADAAIVGSALVRRIAENADPSTQAAQFVQEITQ